MKNSAGESPLGQVIADAQLAATRGAGAQVALMNPGGIRAALPQPADGQLRYEDLFSVQPFYNNLVTLTLTGAQLLQVLEQQWAGRTDGGRVLHVSQGLAYSWDSTRPVGQRVVPGSVVLNGQPLDPSANYRVAVNSFLAAGGDNFSVFKQARAPRTGMMDVDAFEQHIAKGGVPAFAERVRRIN